MNYTYLPDSPFSTLPIIIMTTNPSSRKHINLTQNPRVSLLVHDWVSHRPPTTALPGSTSPELAAQGAGRSGLASLLLGLNTSAVGSISATINGTVKILERDTEEERFYKQAHLDNNTFVPTDAPFAFGTSPGTIPADDSGDGGRGCFIEGEEVRVVVVQVKDGRIADWKGGVRDWVVEDEEQTGLPPGAQGRIEVESAGWGNVNGV